MAFSVGVALTKRLGSAKNLATIIPSDTYKKGKAGALFKAMVAGELELKKFGDKYRAIDPQMDELISTSAVREIMRGAASVDPSGQDFEELVIYFEQISMVRLPTSMVGHATPRSTMQHPAPKATSFFADSRRTMSRHAALDLYRKHAVLEMMLKVFKENGSAADMVNAGVATAYTITVNTMYAPATASNVESLRTPKSNRMQMSLREGAKNAAEAAGAPRIPGEGKPTDDWSGMPTLDISPPRTEETQDKGKGKQTLAERKDASSRSLSAGRRGLPP